MTDKLNLHQRIAAVMAEVTYIQKESKAGMQYKIVSHDKVTAKCRPALLANGVIYYPVRCVTVQSGNRTECNMTVRFANIEDPQDFIDVQTCGYGVDSQDKGPGKAQSYAVKYALLKTLGLETGDDADHDAVEHNHVDPALHQAATAAAIRMIETEQSMDGLGAYWTDLAKNEKAVSADKRVLAAKEKRKAELTETSK
ncbi:single strand-annealing protein [Octadecabacter Antarctic DB virus 2]|nr:single strand-annealing protein [Octadecabacter Antarctic DB virus 2]